MDRWCHPEISLQDLLNLIKGFVDILILASGYQSSGRFAHWDPLNIKKAFQWGLFFENVFKSIDGNQDSLDEVDAALSKLTSEPHFPQGLKCLSSSTLRKARSFILEHMTRTLPMRDTHLKAVLKAAIEMDLDELQKTETDYLHIYLDKLMLQNVTRNQVCIEEDLLDFSPKNPTKIDLTTFAIQGITKRQLAVSRVSSIETSVDVLNKTMTQGNWPEFDDDLLQDGQKHQITFAWNHWRTKTLSYLLDKRTIKLVSGASMIFSAPKVQWVQVFERLDMSGEANVDLCETIELLLVGCISSRWNRVIEHFMLNSRQSLNISTIYEELHNLILGKFQNSELTEETKNSKEQDIVEYLEVKLSNQVHRLWELSPAVIAASLPPRCCSCIDDNKEHTECEVAERIWCLYIFNV